MTQAQQALAPQQQESREIKRQQPPEARLKSLIGEPTIRARFEEMLGKRAPAFLSSIISAVSANKSLASCEPMSVISSAAVAAAMDLPINSSLGFAHIVPYKDVAQFQMGWKGFVQLAMRSGQYKTINITPVLEGQIKNHNVFTGEMEFCAEATSDKVIGYLLYFKLLNGYEKYFYMTRDEVLAHGKKYSASFKRGFGLWVDDFEAMALKTVAKLGLSKYGILSVDMQRGIELDQAVVGEDGEPQYIDAEGRDVTPAEPSRTEKLNQEAAPKPAVTPQVLPKAQDADPSSFANFTGSLFSAPPAAQPVETMESLQLEVHELVTKLGIGAAIFSAQVGGMFKKAPQHLNLAEVRQLRDRYRADLAKGTVK
jgi:recombination protein RecT